MTLRAPCFLSFLVVLLAACADAPPGDLDTVRRTGTDRMVELLERIREEIKRGSALRMAIRNGFARATTTIVDANMTTLITAIVLSDLVQMARTEE